MLQQREEIQLVLTFIKLSHYCQRASGSIGTFEMTINKMLAPVCCAVPLWESICTMGILVCPFVCVCVCVCL